jgi:hypothetical protein
MFVFLDLMLFLGIVAVLLILVTQVIIPLKNGTPLFPIFGKSETAEAIMTAEHTLEELAELEQLARMQAEIDSRKAKLKEPK